VKLICSVLLRYHWTKNLVASPDGKRLYAAAGSNSNAAGNGLKQTPLTPCSAGSKRRCDLAMAGQIIDATIVAAPMCSRIRRD
jgi:glucose/arabinose dehydrogenase